MRIQVCDSGARLPMWIPCLNNNCPSKMSLLNYDGPDPVYRCRREHCEFHDNPKPAKELTHWHTDPSQKKQRKDPTSKEAFETGVL